MARKNFTPNRTCEFCGRMYWCEPTRITVARFCSVACRKDHTLASLPKRFWEGVDKSGGLDACWPWKGATDKGYGVITIQTPEGRRKTLTHRLALKLFGVEVPDQAPVCHKCDNPPCCNPAHLYVGTHLQNTHDAMDRGRKPQRLTEQVVIEARRRYRPYKVGYAQLAREYGCSQITMREAIIGKTWKYLPGARSEGRLSERK